MVFAIREGTYLPFCPSSHSRQEQLYSDPLVVLVDQFSTAGTEMLVAALQDHGRAIIVGDYKTYGYGTIQHLDRFRKNMGVLKATIAQIYRLDGESIQTDGVSPDIILPSINHAFSIGEKTQRFYLPWQKVSAFQYEKISSLGPILKEVEALSKKRVGSHPGFLKIEQWVDDHRDRLQSSEEGANKQTQSLLEQLASSYKSYPLTNSIIKLEQDIHLEEAIFILEDTIRLQNQRVSNQLEH